MHRSAFTHSAAAVIRLFFCCVMLAALHPHAAHGQQRNLKFERIATEDGLSDNYVLCWLQDRHGFIWLGTRDGLNRYDGRNFTIYRHDIHDTLSISDGSVNCIFEDSMGDLWIGTHNGGLNRFDRVRERFVHYTHNPSNPHSIASGRISSICEDRNGDLWIAATTSKEGISRFDRKRRAFIRYRHDPRNPGSLSSDNVSSICKDLAGNIWIATFDKGLNIYDPRTDRFINHHHRPFLSNASVGWPEQIHPDRDGRMWIISDGRLRLLDPRTATVTNLTGFHSYFSPIRPNYIITLYHDRAGMVWVGSSTGGLEITDHALKTFHRVTHDPSDPQSLSSNRIFFVGEDRSGNIWIGTDNGVNRFNRRNWQFRYMTHDRSNPNTLSHRAVRSILRDSHGTLWIGTSGGGLNRIDSASNTIRHYTADHRKPGRLSDQVVNVIYEDRRGDLWIGTNHGLNLYNRKSDTFRWFHHDRNDSTTISQGGIWGILEDGEGMIWFATIRGGVSRYDRATGKFTRFMNDDRDPTSISNNNALTLHEDRAGRLWIGTDVGLNLFDRKSGTFRHYRHNPLDTQSISNDRVWYIHEDAEGIFWIGTSGGGMNRFDPRTGEFRHYTEREGLVNNTVCAIVEDDRGRLWISTNKGMSCFDKKLSTFRNYTAHDGLYVHEFHFKTCFRDRDGTIHFGGGNGVVSFHPDSITDNRHPPNVILTSLKVFDHELPLDTSIVLKRHVRLDNSSNFFTIEFAALDFTNAQRNSYRYMLEGFDEEWRTAPGDRPYAVYTNVPPGDYRFQVQAANSDGVWNARGAELAVTVEPDFWQTWWFQGSAVLLSLAFVGTFGVARIRAIRNKAELQRRLIEYKLTALRAQMNPHFIFNSLNSILHFIIHHDSESAHTYLSKFAKLIRATMEHSKSESITLAEEIESLRFYLDLEALRFDHKFRYDIVIAPSIDVNMIEIPPMLIQPYAENAITYGLAHKEGPGRLTIEIGRDGEWLTCSVIDDGIGRARARAMKNLHPPGHRSRGMEVTRDRLDVLSLLHRRRYMLVVTDRTDTEGNALGTRIDIRVPLDQT